MTNDEHVTRHGKSLHVHRLKPGSAYTVEGCVTLCFKCHGPEPKRASGEPNLNGRGPVVFMTLDSDTDAALESFIADQTIPPDRAPVALKALREFLSKHGYFPPKKPRP